MSTSLSNNVAINFLPGSVSRGPSTFDRSSLSSPTVLRTSYNNAQINFAGNNPLMQSFAQGGNHAASMNNEQLSQSLLNNFDAFEDRSKPGDISQKSLRDIANSPLTGRSADDQNILLAREVLKRPELNKLLDQDSVTGKQDGLINRESTQIAAYGGNPFSSKTNKEVAAQLHKSFDLLKDDFWTSSIKVDNLKEVANRSLTGNADKDRLTQLAREVTSRPDLLKQMDNNFSKDRDGWIRWEALDTLAR